MTIDLMRIREAGAARRRFLQGASITAFSALASSIAGSRASSAAVIDAETLTDEDILNFALNLEYLEAQFFLRGATGHGLPQSDLTGVGQQGGVSGGKAVPFAEKKVQHFFEEIAYTEELHVKFLRKTLGSAAIAQPALNLSSSFTALARAAGVVGPNGTFDPFASEKNFLIGAFIFEDVGVTAYHGAAPSISNKNYLAAAAGILAVEAYHAGAVRAYLDEYNIVEAPTKIAHLRAKLDGTGNDDIGPMELGPNAPTTIANADFHTGIAFARTPQQVLKVVYSGQTGGGGFFPNGTNGAIT